MQLKQIRPRPQEISKQKVFHDGDPYYIETTPLIFTANQWTDFYMIGTSVMKELKAKTTVRHKLKLQ